TADFDNKGGGLYASGLISLDGQRFLNQGAAAGQGGKVGAGRIDFSLAGALANRFGQLESESELHLRAAAASEGLHRQQLALGRLAEGADVQVQPSGLQHAAVGPFAGADVQQAIGGQFAAGGRILHTGNGTFGLDSGQVIRAG
ncbi:hypothetical protein, partial [Pseudomonas aeruginosa]